MTKLSLFYRGVLNSNGTASQKHAIRSVFHPQIRKWCSSLARFESEEIDSPLLHERWLKDGEHVPPMVITKRGDWRFVALSSRHDNMEPNKIPSVHLAITMLRPEPPGAIVVTGGDIDNRLKTLFDALQVPDSNQAANLGEQQNTELPFFCLLEDDKQITQVSVDTAQLLDETSHPSEVVLLIDVEVTNSHLDRW